MPQPLGYLPKLALENNPLTRRYKTLFINYLAIPLQALPNQRFFREERIVETHQSGRRRGNSKLQYNVLIVCSGEQVRSRPQLPRSLRYNISSKVVFLALRTSLLRRRQRLRHHTP